MLSRNLKSQKRLAASVLKCGKHRVYLDPTPGRVNAIRGEMSRRGIRSLIKRGLIIKKSVAGQSRFRCRQYAEAKRKGRHMGPGKRKGSANARTPVKGVWIRRLRVLRKILAKYRARNVIDRHTYHTFYLKAKGNQYKNKKVLIEAVWDAKNTQHKDKLLAEQRDARIARAAAKKDKAAARAAAREANAAAAPTPAA